MLKIHSGFHSELLVLVAVCITLGQTNLDVKQFPEEDTITLLPTEAGVFTYLLYNHNNTVFQLRIILYFTNGSTPSSYTERFNTRSKEIADYNSEDQVFVVNDYKFENTTELVTRTAFVYMIIVRNNQAAVNCSHLVIDLRHDDDDADFPYTVRFNNTDEDPYTSTTPPETTPENIDPTNSTTPGTPPTSENPSNNIKSELSAIEGISETILSTSTPMLLIIIILQAITLVFTACHCARFNKSRRVRDMKQEITDYMRAEENGEAGMQGDLQLHNMKKFDNNVFMRSRHNVVLPGSDATPEYNIKHESDFTPHNKSDFTPGSDRTPHDAPTITVKSDVIPELSRRNIPYISSGGTWTANRYPEVFSENNRHPLIHDEGYDTSLISMNTNFTN